MQRKQLHKIVQGTETKPTKPLASLSPPKEATKQQNKNKEEQQQAVQEKLEKLSLDDTQETLPTTQSPGPSRISTSVDNNFTVTRDQERIQSDDGGDQDTSNSKDVEQPTTTTDEEEQGAGGGGGEEGDGEDPEEIKTKVEATEEQLLKHLERIQVESQETQATIKKMTGYLRALDVAPNEISPTDEGATPQPESQGGGDDIGATGGSGSGASVMVGDVDPITQAALLASIKERTTTIDTTTASSSQEEAGDIMEPVQVSETDPNNIVIVGEIVGGAQIVPSKLTPEEDTHPAASHKVTEVDPQLECSESDNLIGQIAQESDGEKVGDKPTITPIAEPSQQDGTVEGQGSEEEGDGERQSGEGSKAAAGEAIEAPPPSIFHSPSKKPKRQLAASFMNITKE